MINNLRRKLIPNAFSSQVEDFVAFVNRQAAIYRSDNVILTMGDDFHYMMARVWFENMDRLIK